MKCKFCGAELPDDAVVCSVCDAPVEAEQTNNSEAFEPELTETAPEKTKDGKTLALVAMILGIVALVLPFCCCLIACIPFVEYVGAICTFVMSVVGLILGIVANTQAKKAGVKNKMAIVAIILCSIGIVVAIWNVVVTFFADIIKTALMAFGIILP